MQSIKELYKIGKGPSSSHTMGPERASRLFQKETPNADHYRVILYGSLSKTGKGLGTDPVSYTHLRNSLNVLVLMVSILMASMTIMSPEAIFALRADLRASLFTFLFRE